LTEDGEPLWAKRLSSPGSYWEPASIAPAGAGLALAGQGGSAFQVLFLDDQGTITWQKGFEREISVLRVFPREDGDFILSSVESYDGSRTGWVVRVDRQGRTVWSLRIVNSSSCVEYREAWGAGDLLMRPAGGFLRVAGDGGVPQLGPLSGLGSIHSIAASPAGGYLMVGGSATKLVAKTDGEGRNPSCLPDSPSPSISAGPDLIEAGSGFSSADAAAGFEAMEARTRPDGVACVAYCRDPNLVALTIAVDAGGWTDPSAGIHDFGKGSTAAVQAFAEDYHEFLGWTGDVEAGASQEARVSLVMDSDMTIAAHFGLIEAPTGLTGRRMPAPGRPSAIDVLTWSSGYAAAAAYRVFLVRNGAETLLGEVPAARPAYIYRKASRTAPAEYAVCAVTASGREGFRATVTVQ